MFKTFQFLQLIFGNFETYFQHVIVRYILCSNLTLKVNTKSAKFDANLVKFWGIKKAGPL